VGRIAEVLNIAAQRFTELVVRAFVENNQTVDFFSPSGDDSPPMKEDRVLLVRVNGRGNFAACAVLTESQGAEPGEKILFSRDSDGNPKAVLKLLKDGKAALNADEVTLEASGKAALTADEAVLEASKGFTLKGQEVKINDGSKGAARKDDQVKVTIPAGTFIVSVTGQAAGVPNPAPIDVMGTIVQASNSVKVGD